MDLLEKWKERGLGAFTLFEEAIAGIVCILVAPGSCSCGGRQECESDIRDALKCRSVVVVQACRACGLEREFSLCLPNLKGLPPRQRKTGAGIAS